MSFLPSVTHPLAVDLWPAPYNTIIQQRASVTDLEQWQRFPLSLEHFVEWASVMRLPSTGPANGRDRLLVYKTLPDPNCTSACYPISVRIFGFLEDFCLGQYGDWQGYVSAKQLLSQLHTNNFIHSNDNRAMYAVQSLTLTSAGHTVAWQNQLDRLNMACTFASRLLKLPLSKVQFERRLYIQRRVFVKVSA